MRTMNTKRTLAACFLIGFFAFTASACASAPGYGASFGVRVYGPPPALRHEVLVVRPGAGYVWVPGYWDWRGPRFGYAWVSGAWLRPPRAHAVWVAPRWHTHRHATYFVAGHWR